MGKPGSTMVVDEPLLWMMGQALWGPSEVLERHLRTFPWRARRREYSSTCFLPPLDKGIHSRGLPGGCKPEAERGVPGQEIRHSVQRCKVPPGCAHGRGRVDGRAERMWHTMYKCPIWGPNPSSTPASSQAWILSPGEEACHRSRSWPSAVRELSLGTGPMLHATLDVIPCPQAPVSLCWDDTALTLEGVIGSKKVVNGNQSSFRCSRRCPSPAKAGMLGNALWSLTASLTKGTLSFKGLVLNS